ncbi:hypothetical protein GCM10022206_67000 [Streptomyces chiangmaiensis]
MLGVGGHESAPFRSCHIPCMRIKSQLAWWTRWESVRAAYAGPVRTRCVNDAGPAPETVPGPQRTKDDGP